MQDMKFALRMMIKNPMFSVIAVVTLALGIGANTALFSVVNGVLLSPLPFEDGHELALIWTENKSLDQERYFVSPQNYGDWIERQRAFDGIAAYWRNRVTGRLLNGDPVPLQSNLVSPNFFDVMGATAHVGRLFTAQDADLGGRSVAVLSYGAWQRMYGGDVSVVGTAIPIDGGSIELVGVLAPGSEWPKGAELWTTITFPWTIQSRGSRWLTAIGRIRDDRSFEAAAADMDRVAMQLEQEYPGPNSGWRTELVSLQDTIVGDTKRSLWLLLGATALVMLIACANVSNLLLARAEVRSREIAVRTALGAGRLRLARQLITESMAISAIGAVLGVGLAYGGIKVLLAVAPTGIPRLESIEMDGTVLLVAAGSTVVTALLFGLAPLVKMLSPDLSSAIKQGAKGSRGPRGITVQGVFAVTQLALAVTVVVGAGLLVRSFDNLRSADPGFVASDEKLAFDINLSESAYPEGTDVQQFYDRFLRELRDRPVVASATMLSSLPLSENRDYFNTFSMPDRALEADEDPRAWLRQVDAEFLGVMGAKLIEGRTFNDLDRMDTPGVAIINETLARMYWGEESPIGQRLSGTANRFGPLGSIYKNELEIVGVVADLKFDGLRLDAGPTIFFPYAQTSMRLMTVVVEGVRGTEGLLDAARAVLRDLAPALPISNVVPLATVMDDALSADRFSMLLLTTFGVLALVLAAIGIYGVLSYGVEQRIREVGIRMALGAQAQDVLTLIMGRGAKMIALGLITGLGAAAALSGLISSQLFGVESRDPVVYGGVAIILTVVALAASFVPARRATRIDPMTALRAE